MRAILLLTLILASGPSSAEQPDAAQKRCFCVKLSEPGAMPPYFLARMDWQECKGRKLEFPAGRTVYDMGLLNCDDLTACLNPPPKEKKAREAALRKIDEVTKALLACCPKDGDCDKACVSRLEPRLNKAKGYSARLELKALRRQDACIARTPPVTPGKRTASF